MGLDKQNKRKPDALDKTKKPVKERIADVPAQKPAAASQEYHDRIAQARDIRTLPADDVEDPDKLSDYDLEQLGVDVPERSEGSE